MTRLSVARIFATAAWSLNLSHPHRREDDGRLRSGHTQDGCLGRIHERDKLAHAVHARVKVPLLTCPRKDARCRGLGQGFQLAPQRSQLLLHLQQPGRIHFPRHREFVKRLWGWKTVDSEVAPDGPSPKYPAV